MDSFRLCLFLENARERKEKEKVEGKKKQRKIKIDLKSINYFYMLLQTHFTYFHYSI